jgi:hypothetical protein
VVRDLQPAWGTTAVVSAFPDRSHVPPGYFPLVIVDAALPLGRAGFHFSDGGQPGALVQYAADWSVAASHELIELLCDPTGTRTTPGPSLSEPDTYVDYVVEVCDPCGNSSYQIDGVRVSDFVTREYYAPGGEKHARYSFTGRVSGPFELLADGYITWLTAPPDRRMYQAFQPLASIGDPAPDVQVTELGDVPPGFTRQWLDALPSAKPALKWTQRDASPPYVSAQRPPRYGEVLAAEAERVLGSEGPPRVSLGDIIGLIYGLAGLAEDQFRAKFVRDPRSALRALKLPVPPDLSSPLEWELPDETFYANLIPGFEQAARFGLDFTQPGAISYLAKLYTPPGPPVPPPTEPPGEPVPGPEEPVPGPEQPPEEPLPEPEQPVPGPEQPSGQPPDSQPDSSSPFFPDE